MFGGDSIEKVFGEKLKEVEYKDRVGAYAIILNEDNNLLTVKTDKGYFLLGGKIESNENYKDCIKRECIEEAGLEVEVKEFICKASKYTFIDSLKSYIHAIGNFYTAEVKGEISEPIEKNHQLKWIRRDEYHEKLYLEHQVWAIDKAIDLKYI